MRTRVKICGITNAEDLKLAVSLGTDALGFNMFEKSPRFLQVEQARLLVEAVPPFVTAVGLFVNAEPEYVQDLCNELNFDCLQFHGDEDNKYCRQFGKPFIKALRIGSEEDLKQQDEFPDAEACLLDAKVEGLYGGTGKSIPWQVLGELRENAILSGGLNDENVEQAIRQFNPYCVDLSSGIETTVGVKDETKMRNFFKAVKRSQE